MLRMLQTTLILVLVASLLCGCQPRQGATPPAPSTPAASGLTGKVSIYVPCGLIIPIREAAARFEKANPGVKVEGTYDNAITLALKIREKGARPDVYISPGSRKMALIEEKGLIDEATKASIGYFDLAVIVPKGNPKGIHSLEDLTKADAISCPDPEKNSVGMYGKQALEKAGLWAKLMPKGDERIVFTEKAISSHEKVVAGKADAGLAFKNCPLETNPEKLSKASIEIVADLDHALYDMPLCYVAALKEAPNSEAAAAFIDFLCQPETQEFLSTNGMEVLYEDYFWGPEGAPVEVKGFYPENADHRYVKEVLAETVWRNPDKVRAEFIDFTSEQGFQRWKAAGLNCGTILVNGQQTHKVMRDGQPKEVTFMMREGGEWIRADLDYVVKQAIAKAGGAAKPS